MEDATESSDETTRRGARIDWRTGKLALRRDAQFWQEHERQRIEQGLSVRQYCAAHELALSTYRHRVRGTERASSKKANASSPRSSSPAFVAVQPVAAQVAAMVEVALEGMTLRLCGAAAERVVARVMERLA